MNIKITSAGLRNQNFQLIRNSDLFPSDAWGGKNRTLAAKSIRFFFVGTNEEVDTDIDTVHRVPRKARAQIDRFFKFHNAKEGESLVIVKTSDRQYKVEMILASPTTSANALPAISIPPAGTETPPRTSIFTTRVVRETEVSQYIKSLYAHKCQVCGVMLSTRNGPYAEGAHIRPLGSPHNGPDLVSNILCLCPNHHVMLDGGTLSIQEDYTLLGANGKLKVHTAHTIDSAHLEYHRLRIGQAREA